MKIYPFILIWLQRIFIINLLINAVPAIQVLDKIEEEQVLKRTKRIVGGRESAIPPPDDPVVFTQMYGRDARVEGFRNQITKIYQFLGIRYADPPIGINRFQRPRYRRLEGDVDATQFGQPCPQPDPYDMNRVVGNEDCLTLNIYTPNMPDETTGLPVYVWIHPGGFRYGSAAQYDAQPIAAQGMIFVPVQYRLGTLGIIGDNTKDFNGNLAMYDMTAALRWVSEYISFFGGDPKQVKVIGHGSGAASAMYLSMSRLPKSGSINGVVSMSGSALSQYAIDENPVQSIEEIAQLNECPTTNELVIVKCLRKRKAEDIVKTDSMVQTERLQGRSMVKGLSGGLAFNLHQEDPDDNRSLPGFLTTNPTESFQNGTLPKIPLLIGVTKDETGNSFSEQTVNNIWGNAENFLNSLTGTLTNIKGLLKIDQLTGAILQPVLPGLGPLQIGLNDVLKVPKNLSPGQILNKLTETTTDVFFNLPAVLSADIWSKVAPSFLYSFEFKGSLAGGKNFLKGLPIIAGASNPNYTAHGDELAYLFDANDIFGKPIHKAKLTNDKDLKVRSNFIGLLKKFTNIKDNGDGGMKKFGKGTPFIKITDDLQFLDNFRFCELSLWGAPLQAIQTTSCAGFAQGIKALTDVVGNVADTITNPLGALGLTNSKQPPKTAVGSLGGILG